MNKDEMKYLDIKTFDLLRGREWRNLQEGDDKVHSCFLGLDPALHKYTLVSGQNFSTLGNEGDAEFQTKDLIIEPNEQTKPEEHGALLCCSPDFLDNLLLTEEIENVGKWVEHVELHGGFAYLVKIKGIHEVQV